MRSHWTTSYDTVQFNDFDLFTSITSQTFFLFIVGSKQKKSDSLIFHFIVKRTERLSSDQYVFLSTMFVIYFFLHLVIMNSVVAYLLPTHLHHYRQAFQPFTFWHGNYLLLSLFIAACMLFVSCFALRVSTLDVTRN